MNPCVMRFTKPQKVRDVVRPSTASVFPVVNVVNPHPTVQHEEFDNRFVNFFTRFQVLRNEWRGLTDSFGTLANVATGDPELLVVLFQLWGGAFHWLTF